jgi:cellulose 1,4-beta-cellobiosidase
MRLNLGRFSRRRLAAVAVGVVAVAGVAVIPTLPAFAATSCSVTYGAGPWTESPGVGGFTANIVLTNTGDPITAWTLRFTLPSGQTITQPGWSATYAVSGQAVTATNLSYNGNLGTGGQATFGFNGRWTGSYTSPTVFSVNNVTCGGGGGTSTTSTTTVSNTTTTTATRTSTPPPTSQTTTTTTTSTSTTTIPPCQPNCPPHVDNPYAGATGYVNPDWRAKAMAEPGGSRVANTPTGVWLDRVAAIAGSSTSMGLRAHLDAAVTQDAANGANPIYAQFVIYDLPNRDCSALASNGEFRIANNGLNNYKTLYIDPIAAILADPKYAQIRIVLIIEIDSLPNLITNLNVADCQEAQSSGAYVQGIAYALGKFHAIPNVYNYIDAAHHAWIGWPANFGPTADVMSSTANSAVGGRATVDGFIANTANYSALTEPFLQPNGTVNGTQEKSATWYSFNDYVEETAFAVAFRTALVQRGFSSNIGMLIDTSRNGWGSCVMAPCQPIQTTRPTARSTSTDVNTLVNASRIDRRIHAGNWCNQAGAGMGERPRANPLAGVDAYVWIKPPGESDGSSSAIPNDQGKGFDRMCDPTYGGNERNGNSMTGALPNSPISGAWFSAQFQQLMANAFPPLT